ncbi:MAG TPA: DNA-processing protein DprA [Candidatus Nanoarchaeia archaeon]|nr:DNA-processing protein DprA [Candidatus Nanoarchaeia archaeon]
MQINDKDFLIALSYFRPFGPVSLKKLKNYFPSWRNAFNAPATEIVRAGIEEKTADEFAAARINIAPEKIGEYLARENISTVSLEEDEYPELLKEIFYPPFLLFYKGKLSVNGLKTLAVVGARKCTYYGQQAIEKLIPPLAAHKILIISGLAIGIDCLAQMETVKAGGRTIAVLGSGVDRKSIYPAQNLLLAEKIIESGGAIVSEFPPGTPPLKQNFPQRNRIIAGLAQATLVVEANQKSGSLITARFALEEGREVMAVPGNIFSPASEGPNNLIKSGAKPIFSADDILESFGVFAEKNAENHKKDFSQFNLDERKILARLSCEPTPLDELIRATQLDTKIINSTLTILEIKKAVRNVGGGNYILT